MNDAYYLRRMVAAIHAEVQRHRLDLCGLHVLTEAATGAYASTSVIAALAGARVTALAKPSAHGSILRVQEETSRLARALGVYDQIEVVTSLTDAYLQRADIVTNSGHLRPIDRAFVLKMKSNAVIPLMYEAWEVRAGDIDLLACRECGIRVAGTNERHPTVAVFDYLGLLIIRTVLQEGHEILDQRCLIICDNDFSIHLAQPLRTLGADVTLVRDAAEATHAHWDVVVIATTPPESGGKVLSLNGVNASLFCQLWGDVDRRSTSGVWSPVNEPKPGHMGLTLDHLGPVPVIKLQVAGLKCAELMRSPAPHHRDVLVQWVVEPQGQ